MPIVDVELVCESEGEFNAVSPRAIADAVGKVFGSPPGRTWARLVSLTVRTTQKMTHPFPRPTCRFS